MQGLGLALFRARDRNEDMIDPDSAQVTSSGAGQLSSPGLALRLWEREWRWSPMAVGTGCGILS